MKKSLETKLGRLNFIIASHIFATGPALDLEDYLKGKTKSLLFIGHPFPYRKEKNSFYRVYKNGFLKKEIKAFGWKLPEFFFYIKDALYTFFWVTCQKERYDYYIGSDGFDAFLGLILKKFGKVEHVILYTIDYMPNRFKNNTLNFLYHYFDKQCLKNCKIVWNVSPVMAKAREEHNKLKEGECVPQIIVPLGMWYKRIPKLSFEKKKRYQLVFMGHILEKQGLDVVISAMPAILKKIPLAKLLIIGSGEYEDRLKRLAGNLKINKNVEFAGYVEKHEDVERMAAESTISLAMYKPDPASFTTWADPGKLKIYLAAGSPVILTSVPPVAGEIETNKCGIIAEYSKKDLADKAIRLLISTRMLKEYQKNATVWARRFDWDRVFSLALTQTL
ncbi:MAG: glycosyltransferase, partial [Microgenomates group bacterium Gr01-1014_93]